MQHSHIIKAIKKGNTITFCCDKCSGVTIRGGGWLTTVDRINGRLSTPYSSNYKINRSHTLTHSCNISDEDHKMKMLLK